MKNKLLFLWIGLLPLFAKASFAQELQLFYSPSYGYIDNMIYLDEERILAWVYDHNDCYLAVLDNEGVMTDSIHIYTAPADIPYPYWLRHSALEYFADGTLGFFMLKFTGDTAHMQRITINEDLTLTYKDYQWESTDTSTLQDIVNCQNWLVNKDGSVLFTFLIEESKATLTDRARYDALHLIKFNDKGVVVADTVMFHDFYYFYNHPDYHLLPTPDSLGYRIVLSGRPEHQFDIFDCYTLDADLNIVAVKENIDQLSFPALCGRDACLRMNPYNGRTYSIGIGDEIIPHVYGPEYIHEQDALMSVFDAENFEQLNYTWGITRPTYATMGCENSIDFDDEGGVYMVTGMDQYTYCSTSLYVAYLDEDLQKHCELYFRPELGFEYCYTGGMCVGPSGDVLIRCNYVYDNSFNYKRCLFRVPSSAFDGIDEAHANGLKVAIAYPNPGQDVLNIRTALQNARVEVYDLNGRLMHGQEITGNITSIPAEAWPAGVYVWKVMANGKEAETGKWVKE